MKVFVVYYDVESREDWLPGAEPMIRLDGVFDTFEKARDRARELEKNHGFYADFEIFDLQ